MYKLLSPAKVAVTLATLSALAACSVAFAQMTPPHPGVEESKTAYRLQALVLQANELATFVPILCALADPNVEQWANGDRATVAALRSDGFVMGIREPLHSTAQHASATSAAAKFQTVQGAQHDVERQLAAARQAGAVTTFAVSGIPGALGFTRSAHGTEGYRVIFTDGSYEYLVGVERRGELPSGSSVTQLTKAAQLVYDRARSGDTQGTIRISVNHK
jgi:hypothetical protein